MHSRFKILDSFLLEHQIYWRSDPFHLCRTQQTPWRNVNRPLVDWLEGLSIQRIQTLKEQPQLVADELTLFLPQLYSVNQNIQFDRATLAGLKLARGTGDGIPGRKLQQIVSMGEAVLENHYGKEWLEWCSGKGFLGRILSQQSKQKVTSFEWQQSLCESGQAIADAQQLDMTFVQGDAFTEDAEEVFNIDQHAVALHACGDLHVELVKKSVFHGLPAVTISPCCYHLIREDVYQAMSCVARSSALTLSKSDLRIPLQETVTGGERVKRHRQLEMSYRLGFCQLLKAELGIDEYIPIPSIKKSELSEGFESFCGWASEVKGMSLGAGINFGLYLEQGEALFWEMEKLSLVQQVFRRPLEIWLALDRAIYLQEQGYEASIEEFCERSITPRNLLIHGVKLDR
ncbi:MULTISPECIES: methyltransferase [Vibrio]|uniref:methyltransferase n=1 Tax=Vibrio TaxID=662 RepID=UPI000374576C|nr:MULTISPECIES: methyltransferase [Vibrio]KNH13788.1 SAM-dependent methyltransferase [Vibrio lentus]MBY7659827.1 methyltransferase [Vibrio atlanticus]ERM61291.1 SAM-dependent methyltransferase [Vibrio cyclitrophicus FF75]MBE8558886.1 methyltransferase [Vibrio sp. OPT24]MBE8605559.1 methyltransferase [Vibrio sp. OPT10]|tara:strand:- start:130 stop:1332 length:1203 start_codon:yes stop_codon:yes gene_type:complete